MAGRIKANLSRHHQKQLEEPGTLIGDEVVTMLLL